MLFKVNDETELALAILAELVYSFTLVYLSWQRRMSSIWLGRFHRNIEYCKTINVCCHYILHF